MATVDYKIIKNFFSKEELKVVDVYCQQKLDQIYTGGPYDGYMDGQTFSPSWYRDALTTAFLEAKIPLIEKEMNIKLLPSYSYWRYYIYGADLKKHYDRPSCEISVSACMKKYDNWPFIIEGESIELEEGDGLVYCGYMHEHSRPGIYKGEGMAQTFLHYVLKDGSFPHHAYDAFKRFHGFEMTEEDRKIVNKRRADRRLKNGKKV